MIRPGDSTLVINGVSLLVDDIKFRTDIEFFERLEFSNERLRQAVEATTGRRPVYIELPGGLPAILDDPCLDPIDRPLAPDDDNLDNIFRRWDIKRWELQGASTASASVDTTFALSRSHKVLLARFQAHINQARANISYAALIAMQAETFSYLTATGINMSGLPLGLGTDITINNIIVSQFIPDVDTEEPLDYPHTESLVMRKWSAVVEVRTNVSARSAIY